MSHLDRSEPPLLDLMEGAGASSSVQSSTVTEAVRVVPSTQVNASTSNDQRLSPSDASLTQICSLMLEQSRQQQALMQRMLAAMNLNNPPCSAPFVATGPQSLLAGSSLQDQGPSLQDQGPSLQDQRPAHHVQRPALHGQWSSLQDQGFSLNNRDPSLQFQRLSHQDERPLLSSSTTAQAVKLLSSHLPDFCGLEDEDVESWVHTVERVAQIHKVSTDILLLAATGKLKKTARKWFDLNVTTLIDSWLFFRESIVKRFKRTILFHVAIQKVEARKWNFLKESFHDYSMDKLVLTKNLSLSDRDIIHLLINGIGSRSLRELAASLQTLSVDDFLEKMQSITSASGEAQKRSPIPARKMQPIKAVSQPPSKESKDSKELYCVYCRSKGHTRDECLKLKKKDKLLPGQPSHKASSPVAAVEQQKGVVSAAFSTVASMVADTANRKIEICDSRLKIVSINDCACNIRALLDTGSPISLVRPSIAKEFNLTGCSLPNSAISKCLQSGLVSSGDFRFKTINNHPIKISGLVSTTIKLQALPLFVADIDLHILEDDSCSLDLIIGRDFVKNNAISVFYNPSGENLENKILLFQEMASSEIATVKNEDLRSVLSNLETDFGLEAKGLLISAILEVEDTELPLIEDEHMVKLSLKDETVFAFAPRRFAWAERLQLREITDDLLQRGVIKYSSSPYCARVVPVRKKNGSLRLCVDMRPLNSKIIKQKYPFPLIEDCLARLSNRSVFTLLDLKDSFYQIKLHPEFTKFFAFATPDGQFEFTRLPFGFYEAPAEFQRRLIHILQPLIRDDEIIVYIDDILIPSDTVQENLSVLKKVLLLLKQYKFDVNVNKCLFLKKELEYLGYTLSPSGITLSVRHTNAISNFPRPKNVTEVQRFLGLTNYFRKFIKDYAKLARPLQNLLCKATNFVFDDSCLTAFESLKSALTSFPVLRLYDPSADTELHTDASARAIAAILLQKQGTGQWAPISYYSQSTNKAESQYHSYELEMLAVVKAIERFHIYLYGLKFSVITDCHALVYAVNKAQLNPRIARWTLRLQNYDFSVTHREGKRMSHVDALSRIVAYHEPLPLDVELQYRQLQDDRLKAIAEKLEFSSDEKFELIEGLVYKKGPDKSRFVVPESMVSNIIRVYHDKMAHCGTEKTVQGISSNYWFPHLRKRTQDYISNCLSCIMNNVSSNTNEGELQLTEEPKAPFTRLHTDHFGPIAPSVEGFKHILLVVDAFSRFVWLFPCKTTASKETIKHFNALFQTFGNPEVVTSDRGTSFTSQDFTKYLSSRGIKHTLIAVAAPWANGIVERINRFLKSSLRKLIEDPATWHSWLEATQYVINNTFHSSLKSSPSKLLLGYDQRGHPDSKLVRFLNDLAKVELNTELIRQDAQRLAAETTNRIKAYNKDYYDSHHKKPTIPGDYVMIRDSNVKPGESKKFKPSYKGPYLVAKALDKNRYVIQDIPGFNVSPRPYNSILSPDRLKLWIKPIQPQVPM